MLPRLNVYLKQEDMERVKRAADYHSQSISTWVRGLVMRELRAFEREHPQVETESSKQRTLVNLPNLKLRQPKGRK